MSLLDFFIDDYSPLDSIKSKSFEVELKNVTFSPFSQMKCLNCGMYRRNWHCANNPRYDNAKKILLKFSRHWLIWAEMDATERLIYHGKRFPKKKGYILGLHVGNQVFALIKKQLQDDISTLHEYCINKGIDHKIFGAGGGCTHCRDCGYLTDPRVKCKKPGISFPSIESWGVDVYKTFRDNGLEIESPPNKVYRVVGFLSANF